MGLSIFSGTEFPFDFAAGLATGGKPKPSIAVPLSLTLSPLWLSKEDIAVGAHLMTIMATTDEIFMLGGQRFNLKKKNKKRGPLIKVQSVE